MWARLPAAGPSEGARRTTRSDVPARARRGRRPTSARREHAPLAAGRGGRARRSAPRPAGRPSSAASSACEVLEPPRDLAPVRALGRGRARARVERLVAGRRRRPTARRRARPTSAPRGRRRRTRSRADDGGGRVVEREQGGRQRRWRRAASSPSAEDAASSATWRQRLSVPRAGAGPAAAMKGSVTSELAVADGRERRAAGYARRVNRLARRVQPVPAPARREPGRLVALGRRGPRPAPAPRTGRCCSRSATRRATGAT